MSNTNEKFQNLDEKTLIEKYHKYPQTYLILNVITTILFVFAFACAGIFQESGTVAMLVFLVIGSIFVIFCNHYTSKNSRTAIVDEFSRRYSQKYGKKGIYCLAKREQELYGKSLTNNSENVCTKIGRIFRVVNYIFYIFSALLLVVFSAIPLVISVFLYMAYIIFVAARVNGLAESCVKGASYCAIPLKIAFKFFCNVISLKGVGGTADNLSESDYSSVFKDIPNEQNSRLVAELKIDKYLSLDPVRLPSNCYWNGVPSISASASTVYVEGLIYADSIAYHNDSDLNKAIQETVDEVARVVGSQIDKFLKDYPKAERASLQFDIKGEIKKM